ncbi:MAG: hypothetical protein AAGA48_01385 [Myxococcota bacterium]
MLRITALWALLTGCVGTEPDTTPTDETATPTETLPTAETGEKKSPDTPPVVTITMPKKAQSSLFYDGYDNDAMLWYKDVTFEGTATDAEDGELSGASLVWTTNKSGIQEAELGTGGSITARLYSDDCFGATHNITLTGTDSDGNAVSAVVEIFIYTVC